MSAYYQLLDKTVTDDVVCAYYKPNIHAQGAWNPHEQHMAPASGLMAAELEQFMPRADLRIGRISYDIFGLISFAEFSITTKIIRAGKTIELVESEMKSNNKTCIVARAWRMRTQDSSSVIGIEDQPPVSPENCPKWAGLRRWAGGYIQSLTARRAPGSRPGNGMVWLNNDLQMVEGQPTSDFAHLIGMVDTANGIVPRQDGDFKWAFPNLDLQIHLYRLPVGKWLGLATTQQYGADGIGLTSSVLHDVQGPFGHCEQILTIRPMA